jgi:hypothetical protein
MLIGDPKVEALARIRTESIVTGRAAAGTTTNAKVSVARGIP